MLRESCSSLAIVTAKGVQFCQYRSPNAVFGVEESVPEPLRTQWISSQLVWLSAEEPHVHRLFEFFLNHFGSSATIEEARGDIASVDNVVGGDVSGTVAPPSLYVGRYTNHVLLRGVADASVVTSVIERRFVGQRVYSQ